MHFRHRQTDTDIVVVATAHRYMHEMYILHLALKIYCQT